MGTRSHHRRWSRPQDSRTNSLTKASFDRFNRGKPAIYSLGMPLPSALGAAAPTEMPVTSRHVVGNFHQLQPLVYRIGDCASTATLGDARSKGDQVGSNENKTLYSLTASKVNPDTASMKDSTTATSGASSMIVSSRKATDGRGRTERWIYGQHNKIEGIPRNRQLPFRHGDVKFVDRNGDGKIGTTVFSGMHMHSDGKDFTPPRKLSWG